MQYTDFCRKPFEELEIHIDGSAFVCCPAFNYKYSVGNIFEQSLEEIWNGEEVIDLRTKILNSDYSLCNKETCFFLRNKSDEKKFDTNCKPIMEEYPKLISFCYDEECNSACIICREKLLTLNEERLEFLNSKIDTLFIPLLRDTKILTINSAGDVFGSRHSRLLLKKAIETYPDLKYELLTNGLLCNKQTFDELKLTPDKIHSLKISLHASNRNTYGEIVRNGEQKFDTIVKNIEFISEVKKQNHFDFVLNFVVTSLNYKDIPDFIKLAEKYGATPVFWEYRIYNEYSGKMYKELSVIESDNKEYKNLKRVLHKPLVKKYRNSLYKSLQNIQDEKEDSFFDFLKSFQIKK